MLSNPSRWILAAMLALSAGPVFGAASPLQLDDPALPAALQAAARDEVVLRLEVPLEAEASGVLELRPFEVFAADARLIVSRRDGEERLALPRTEYFRGTVAGRPGSRALVSVRESGEVRGVVAEGGRYWLLAPAASSLDGGDLPAFREVDVATELAEESGTFGCESDLLPPTERLFLPAAGVTPPSARVDSRPVEGLGLPGYTARIAVETDFELYQRFDTETEMIDYIGDLFGFASTIYADEVDTSLLVSSISLWDNAGDPYAEPPGTCGLFEFGRYWNDNQSGVDRTIAHMLSGKNTNAGVAWVGVLCNGAFNTDHQGSCPGLSPNVDNYGGDYGYTGGIDGNFDIDNPAVIWDIVGVAHEVGHNFNSPHTHCYEGLGGNSAAVDNCFSGQCGQSGCFCGPASLPCGTTGGGCGTIMSYCHFLGGGLANISMTFGQGHPWGVQPERVPSRMNDHVVSRAGADPSCLAFTQLGEIFADGFESGDTSTWSGTSP